MKSLHERILDAQEYAARWLAKGNQYAEDGKKGPAERCYEKAQKYLDRLNELEGRA